MQDFEKLGAFYLGKLYELETSQPKPDLLLYESKDLTTHAVCVGMTGSGKTGLCLSLLKEAGIDKIPAIAIIGERDYGIRFFGVPGGYEFTTFIKDIISVSKREHGLSNAIATELKKVDKPVHLQVLVSPT